MFSKCLVRGFRGIRPIPTSKGESFVDSCFAELSSNFPQRRNRSNLAGLVLIRGLRILINVWIDLFDYHLFLGGLYLSRSSWQVLIFSMTSNKLLWIWGLSTMLVSLVHQVERMHKSRTNLQRILIWHFYMYKQAPLFFITCLLKLVQHRALFPFMEFH